MSLPILFFYGFSFAGIVHSVIYSLTAIRNKKTAELIITLFLFAQSLIILEYVFFWTGLDHHYHYLCNVSLVLMLLFGPLLLMYVDFVFLENKQIGTYFFHFMPALVTGLLMLPYFFSTADLKLNHYKMIKYLILDFKSVVYFIMAHMTFYFIFILIKILREKRVGYIKNWLLIINGLFGFYIACYISYYIMVRYSWFTIKTDYFVSIGMCASIIAIIYFAYAKKKVFDGYPLSESLNLENIYFTYKETTTQSNPLKKKEQTITYNFPAAFSEASTLVEMEKKMEVEPINEVGTSKYKNSGLTNDAGKELAEALNLLMQRDKLYRENEIKLETLASKLGIAKHYVSQVINQHYNVNFFEYINMLRIEEAKQLLIVSNKKAMNIIEVAYTVGYNTKNTFNTAFRRIVGVTPTEYRNQNRVRMN